MTPKIQNSVLDDLYRCLSDSRRRTVLHCLKVAETPITIGKLSTLVASHERKISEKYNKSTFEEEVHTTLYHKHIPILARRDVINQPSQEEVVPGNYFDDAVSLLGSQGPTIEVVCEKCGERQLIVEWGASCKECKANNLSPIDFNEN